MVCVEVAAVRDFKHRDFKSHKIEPFQFFHKIRCSIQILKMLMEHPVLIHKIVSNPNVPRTIPHESESLLKIKLQRLETGSFLFISPSHKGQGVHQASASLHKR